MSILPRSGWSREAAGHRLNHRSGASPLASPARGRHEGGGAEPNSELARQLALHAEEALRERLAKGGIKPKLPYLETMPPFAYFSEQEVVALADYLKRLGGVAEKGAPVQKVNQSAMRIGEQVVRGTCRVCHDATGRAVDTP